MAQILLSAQILATLFVLGAAMYFGNRRLRTCEEVIANPPGDKALQAAQTEKDQLAARVERLVSLIARKEENISKD